MRTLPKVTALLVILTTVAVVAKHKDGTTEPKTFEEVLKYDYLTNINSSVESWPDLDTLYRLVRYQPRHIHLAYGGKA